MLPLFFYEKVESAHSKWFVLCLCFKAKGISCEVMCGQLEELF